ncbi:MAG: c-type cytochrome [Acidobacteriota bacterium]|nr:c-type cytochrome [Acidobacteriota bacterium]
MFFKSAFIDSSLRHLLALCAGAAVLAGTACNRGKETTTSKVPHAASDGPGITQNPHPHQTGNPISGRDVFRFETFGNEGFWTDAARLPKGMMDAKFTPKQALEAGLQVDVEAIDPAMRKVMEAELKTDMSPQSAPTLNDPKTTVALVNANAVVGIVPKDSNGDGKLDIMNGDKVGIACTICHTITDKSVFDMPKGGSIGRRVDGPAALTLNVGKLMAMAANSRALYPNLQQTFLGVSIGRAPSGLGPDSTEAEVDAYLSNPAFYPVGTFDETQDGIGNPVKNTPLFRQDLAAPYGSAGEFSKLDDIGNSSYTTNLDPTTLLTPEGRQFLEIKAGPAGKQLANEYAKILQDTGVTGFPFVKAQMTGKVGDPASIVGRRVDNQKLLDMNAYLDQLPAPAGAKVNAEMAARGREVFRANCTQCHNVDQSKFVPPMLVEMKTIWPGYTPIPVGKRGDPKLSTIQNSAGIFDDKMIVVDASDRGEKRGNAMPLLLDLARTNIFLHDGSVSSLDNLLDPMRGDNAPHPFYLADASQRADMVEFLRSLDTTSSNRATRSTVRPQPEKHESLPLWAGFFVAAAGIVWLNAKK